MYRPWFSVMHVFPFVVYRLGGITLVLLHLVGKISLHGFKSLFCIQSSLAASCGVTLL